MARPLPSSHCYSPSISGSSSTAPPLYYLLFFRELPANWDLFLSSRSVQRTKWGPLKGRRRSWRKSSSHFPFCSMHYTVPSSALTLGGRGRNFICKKESSNPSFPAPPSSSLFLIIVSARKVSSLWLPDCLVTPYAPCTDYQKVFCAHWVFHSIVPRNCLDQDDRQLISLDLVNTSQLIKPSKQANKVFVLLRKHLAFSSVPLPPFLPLLACNFKPHVKQRNMRWFTRKQIFLFLSNFPSSFFYIVFAGNKHQYIRPRVCKTPNTHYWKKNVEKGLIFHPNLGESFWEHF